MVSIRSSSRERNSAPAPDTLDETLPGNRVLPYKYLYRHLDGLGLKAVLVRPCLIDWNVISHSHTLEQMLEEIGEPVYRWKRKDPDATS